MSSPPLLREIAALLGQADISYMLTGSFASAFYGSPRSTQDIDLVIGASGPQLQAFVVSLPGNRYYVDLNAALEAHRRESMFNVIDLESGWKIDMIIRKSRAFSQEEFARKRRVNVQGTYIFVASAEDVLISKLEWANLGGSQRQIEDAAGILKILSASLDRSYLNRWVCALGLTREWAAALRMSTIPGFQ